MSIELAASDDAAVIAEALALIQDLKNNPRVMWLLIASTRNTLSHEKMTTEQISKLSQKIASDFLGINVEDLPPYTK